MLNRMAWLIVPLLAAGHPVAEAGRPAMKTLSRCLAVEGHDMDPSSAINMVPVTDLIPPPPGHSRHGDGVMKHKGALVPIRSEVVTPPRHGTLTLTDAEHQFYRYQARDSDYGLDRATLRVDIGAYRYRVKLTLDSVRNKDLYGCGL